MTPKAYRRRRYRRRMYFERVKQHAMYVGDLLGDRRQQRRTLRMIARAYRVPFRLVDPERLPPVALAKPTKGRRR